MKGKIASSEVNLCTLPKVAIFGGSFDPLHNGHFGIMHAVLGELGIKHLIILPAFCSPFKHSSLLSPQARLSLCKLAAAHLAKDYPKARIEVCDFEIACAQSTYSIESVRYLRSKLGGECADSLDCAPDLADMDSVDSIESRGERRDLAGDYTRIGFVLGWDSFAQFHLWREYDELARKVVLLVFDRGGQSEGEFKILAESLNLAGLCARFVPFRHTISSTRIREQLSYGNFSEIPSFLLPALKEFLQKPCYNAAQNQP